jgi:hypothetical protein
MNQRGGSRGPPSRLSVTRSSPLPEFPAPGQVPGGWEPPLARASVPGRHLRPPRQSTGDGRAVRPRAERPAPERRALQERERQPAGCSAAPGAASTGTADPTVAPDRLDPLAAGDPDHLGATVTEQDDQHAAERAGRAPHQGRLARKWPHPGRQMCGDPGAGPAGASSTLRPSATSPPCCGSVGTPGRRRGGRPS